MTEQYGEFADEVRPGGATRPQGRALQPVTEAGGGQDGRTQPGVTDENAEMARNG